MKIVLEPVELTDAEKTVLEENAISFSGLLDIANKKIDFGDMTQIMIMDYIANKKKALNSRFREFKNDIDDFNIAIDIASSLNIKQDINGEILKKLRLELNKESVVV